MEFFNLFANYSDSIIATVNIILVIFVFLQLRDTRKPVISTNVISRNKKVTDRPDVLESDTQYLVVFNDSKNIAKSIDINYQFNFDGHSINVKEKNLSHLNPKEATKILLKIKPIMDEYHALFEEVVEGNSTKIIPKKTLNIDLIVTVRYNPIIANSFKYEIEDNYAVEWGSLKNYPRFKDHPIFKSWNKRNDEYYIYKTEGQEFEKEGENSNKW